MSAHTYSSLWTAYWFGVFTTPTATAIVYWAAHWIASRKERRAIHDLQAQALNNLLQRERDRQ